MGPANASDNTVDARSQARNETPDRQLATVAAAQQLGNLAQSDAYAPDVVDVEALEVAVNTCDLQSQKLWQTVAAVSFSY